ncbi:MAG: hypothetical protein KAX84_04625 [Burkholderiales bacterium]|nr:hypothetical protein [Burkholderiales bacterium]
MQVFGRTAALLLAAAMCCGLVQAQVPRQINYQGHLTDPGGAPITATMSIQFKLYTVAIGGTELYSETQSVSVSNGVFNVLLGSPTPIPGSVPFDQPYYLGITVGNDAEMTPRQVVAASAYAIRAASAESLAAGATVPGSQIIGTITTATIPSSQITGAISGPPWIVATAPAQQAAANTAYLINGAAHVNVTMPATPAVGDTVKVLAAAGSGGFTIVPNNGQSFEVSNSVITTWTKRDSPRDWIGIASSADGTKLAALVDGGKIYTSTDSGVTWTPRESARSWRAIASSADGTKLAAVVGGGQIYTSTDSGVTWTPRDSARTWSAIASSANGNKLVAAVGGGQLFTSTDSGATWVPRGYGPQNWVFIASSSDGVKLAATGFTQFISGGATYPVPIYISNNSGVIWGPVVDTEQYGWGGIASSADGNKLAAVITGGQIHTSTDSGATWTPRGSARNWTVIASSADGTKLAAGTRDGTIFTSTDGGATWIQRLGLPGLGLPPEISGIASSADGRRLAAVAGHLDSIYTMAFTTISGGNSSTAAAELVYAGGGLWLEMNLQGLLTSP